MGIAAVSFKDKNGIEIVIYPQGEWDTIDFNVATEDEGTDMIAYEEKKLRLKLRSQSLILQLQWMDRKY